MKKKIAVLLLTLTILAGVQRDTAQNAITHIINTTVF